MSRTYVIDTSALKFRYLHASPHANISARFSSIRRRMRALVNDKRNQCYIAENTMFEVMSAFGSVVRGNATWKPEHYDAMSEAFNRDVAEERLIVRIPSMREFTRVRHLLRAVGVVQKRSLGSLDAIVISSALEVAYELRHRVKLYTADKAMSSMVADLEPFKSVLAVEYLLKT